jgi:hypothetical protein
LFVSRSFDKLRFPALDIFQIEGELLGQGAQSEGGHMADGRRLDGIRLRPAAVTIPLERRDAGTLSLRIRSEFQEMPGTCLTFRKRADSLAFRRTSVSAPCADWSTKGSYA